MIYRFVNEVVDEEKERVFSDIFNKYADEKNLIIPEGATMEAVTDGVWLCVLGEAVLVASTVTGVFGYVSDTLYTDGFLGGLIRIGSASLHHF